jgi:hypothetical protein
MHVLFKQQCEIEGMKFGPNIHKKPGVFTCPVHFLLDWFFVGLLKDQRAKIQSITQEEVDSLEGLFKAHAEKVEKVTGKEFEVDPFLISLIDGLLPKEEESKDEESDSTGGSGDSDVDADKGEQKETVQDEQSEDGEKLLPSESSNDETQDVVVSEDQKEFDLLHKKVKRLNNIEKKRYEELKAKLKIEE